LPENKLANEKSPYLLQHKDNPVDWYPWGEEAFAKAKAENKPVFLSIGYSTCHWCHVMAHESFENEDIATGMNTAFINIKLDREERPDIDAIYMHVCQMLTGAGGWPLTIIMTPDKKPFFAGTYFPPYGRGNRPGMADIINKVHDLWSNERAGLYESAEEITKQITSDISEGAAELPESHVLKKTFHELASNFDDRFGGIGRRPKFPVPQHYLFLLRQWKNDGNTEALYMTERSLRQMRKGGIYDHAGFGFHRYSTDEQWLLPHFEKMLYDQAWISEAFMETWLATKSDFYKKTAEEIFQYVFRDLTSPEGAFYSAEDADSEGEEGKFYVWEFEELRKILIGEVDFAIDIFNISPKGNFNDEASGQPSGKNILHMTDEIVEIAQKYGLTEDEVNAKIEKIRSDLLAEREKRIRPGLDDKILTDWNGMMIASLAKAGRIFGEKKYTEAAEKAANFLLEKMFDGEKLLHRYKDGDAGIDGMFDDYAFLIRALLELYETTFDTNYLKKALELEKITEEKFLDAENGGYYFTSVDAEKLITRKKEIYDGAVPSGNSVMLTNLMKIARITADSKYENRAAGLLKAFSRNIMHSPSAFTMMLSGFDYFLGESAEIIIAGNPESQDTKKILDLVNSKFIPNKVVLLKKPGDSKLEQIAPYTVPYKEIDGATAYICRNYACEQPTGNLGAIEKMLDKL
jgi:uncharacterized protein YyaL (SSP411 family)